MLIEERKLYKDDKGRYVYKVFIKTDNQAGFLVKLRDVNKKLENLIRLWENPDAFKASFTVYDNEGVPLIKSKE